MSGKAPAPAKGTTRSAEDVIHINWETRYYSPEKMLSDGYRVVNATWDPLYVVDHYPRINFTMTSPQYIYEQLQLTRFKSVDPGSRNLTENLIQVEPLGSINGFLHVLVGGPRGKLPQDVCPTNDPLC